MNRGDENGISILSKIRQLEDEEMIAGSLGFPVSKYLTLQCLYLRVGDSVSARHLWNRIPESMKTEHPQLKMANDMVTLSYQHCYPDFLAAVRKAISGCEMPSFVREDLHAIRDKAEKDTIVAISLAYSRLHVKELAKLLALPKKEALKVMTGWTLSQDGKYVNAPETKPQQRDVSVDQKRIMEKLTLYMCGLENHWVIYLIELHFSMLNIAFLRSYAYLCGVLIGFV